jgi:hypothetical protein
VAVDAIQWPVALYRQAANCEFHTGQAAAAPWMKLSSRGA